MTIKSLTTDAEILLSWPAVFALRPHLTQEHFLTQVRAQMAEDGYRMIGAFVEENGKEVIAAFSGFRNMYKLSSGPGIYIDDLSTLPSHRGKGYAGALLDHIHALAKAEGKTNVQLDSGHHRKDAHRLYLNKRYVISAHHFTRDID
jgi:GNAT superfamily N-acetyltransferase